jgi:hypothetical protein
LKVTYTEEAVADIVEAITYLNERNPTAAANLDADPAGWPSDVLARNPPGNGAMSVNRYSARAASNVGEGSPP